MLKKKPAIVVSDKWRKALSHAQSTKKSHTLGLCDRFNETLRQLQAALSSTKEEECLVHLRSHLYEIPFFQDLWSFNRKKNREAAAEAAKQQQINSVIGGGCGDTTSTTSRNHPTTANLQKQQSQRAQVISLLDGSDSDDQSPSSNLSKNAKQKPAAFSNTAANEPKSPHMLSDSFLEKIERDRENKFLKQLGCVWYEKDAYVYHQNDNATSAMCFYIVWFGEVEEIIIEDQQVIDDQTTVNQQKPGQHLPPQPSPNNNNAQTATLRSSGSTHPLKQTHHQSSHPKIISADPTGTTTTTKNNSNVQSTTPVVPTQTIRCRRRKKPGDFFGEKELLYKGQRYASVRCVEETCLLYITEQTFWLHEVNTFLLDLNPILHGLNTRYPKKTIITQFLSPSDIMYLAYQQETLNFSFGGVVFKQGEISDSLYTLGTGQVRFAKIVVAQDIELLENARVKKPQKEFALGFVTSPEIFGEENILDELKRKKDKPNNNIRTFSAIVDSDRAFVHRLAYADLFARLFRRNDERDTYRLLKPMVLPKSDWRNQQTIKTEENRQLCEFVTPKSTNLLACTSIQTAKEGFNLCYKHRRILNPAEDTTTIPTAATSTVATTTNVAAAAAGYNSLGLTTTIQSNMYNNPDTYELSNVEAQTNQNNNNNNNNNSDNQMSAPCFHIECEFYNEKAPISQKNLWYQRKNFRNVKSPSSTNNKQIALQKQESGVVSNVSMQNINMELSSTSALVKCLYENSRAKITKSPSKPQQQIQQPPLRTNTFQTTMTIEPQQQSSTIPVTNTLQQSQFEFQSEKTLQVPSSGLTSRAATTQGMQRFTSTSFSIPLQIEENSGTQLDSNAFAAITTATAAVAPAPASPKADRKLCVVSPVSHAQLGMTYSTQQRWRGNEQQDQKFNILSNDLLVETGVGDIRVITDIDAYTRSSDYIDQLIQNKLSSFKARNSPECLETPLLNIPLHISQQPPPSVNNNFYSEQPDQQSQEHIVYQQRSPTKQSNDSSSSNRNNKQSNSNHASFKSAEEHVRKQFSNPMAQGWSSQEAHRFYQALKDLQMKRTELRATTPHSQSKFKRLQRMNMSTGQVRSSNDHESSLNQAKVIFLNVVDKYFKGALEDSAAQTYTPSSQQPSILDQPVHVPSRSKSSFVNFFRSKSKAQQELKSPSENFTTKRGKSATKLTYDLNQQSQQSTLNMIEKRSNSANKDYNNSNRCNQQQQFDVFSWNNFNNIDIVSDAATINNITVQNKQQFITSNKFFKNKVVAQQFQNNSDREQYQQFSRTFSSSMHKREASNPQNAVSTPVKSSSKNINRQQNRAASSSSNSSYSNWRSDEKQRKNHSQEEQDEEQSKQQQFNRFKKSAATTNFNSSEIIQHSNKVKNDSLMEYFNNALQNQNSSCSNSQKEDLMNKRRIHSSNSNRIGDTFTPLSASKELKPVFQTRKFIGSPSKKQQQQHHR